MTTTANKIQDFGAKIGGARKDLYAEAREFAETYAAAANVETLKKCSSFGALVTVQGSQGVARYLKAVSSHYRGLRKSHIIESF